MIPRIASIFASGDVKKINEYIIKSFRFVFFLAFPMMLGIIAISKEFVPIFLGKGYDKAVVIINILAPMILLMRNYKRNRNTIFTTNQEAKKVHTINTCRANCKHNTKLNLNNNKWSIWSSSCNDDFTASCSNRTSILCKKTDKCPIRI